MVTLCKLNGTSNQTRYEPCRLVVALRASIADHILTPKTTATSATSATSATNYASTVLLISKTTATNDTSDTNDTNDTNYALK